VRRAVVEVAGIERMGPPRLHAALTRVARDADQVRLIGDGLQHALADPEAGVGGQARAGRRIEPRDRLKKADESLGDQILERHPAIPVLLGDVDDEAGVRGDEARHLLAVAASRAGSDRARFHRATSLETGSVGAPRGDRVTGM